MKKKIFKIAICGNTKIGKTKMIDGFFNKLNQRDNSNINQHITIIRKLDKTYKLFGNVSIMFYDFPGNQHPNFENVQFDLVLVCVDFSKIKSYHSLLKYNSDKFKKMLVEFNNGYIDDNTKQQLKNNAKKVMNVSRYITINLSDQESVLYGLYKITHYLIKSKSIVTRLLKKCCK